MKSNLVVGIRGLIRGNFHWMTFPEILNKVAPDTYFLPLEMAGNGLRSKDLSHMNPEEVIQDFRQQLQTWRKNHPEFQSTPITVLAISLGGMLALKWAELYPEEIDQLIVVNSSLKQCSPFYKRLIPKNYFQIFKTLSFGSIEAQEALILNVTSNNPDLQKSLMPKYIEFSTVNKIRSSNFLRQLILASRIKLNKPLKINPVFICSEKDGLVSAECSMALAAKFNGTIHVNTVAGHDLSFDQPEWLAQKISSLQSLLRNH
jgi:pimeloyl-ACP methyl ester carboxylesterase